MSRPSEGAAASRVVKLSLRPGAHAICPTSVLDLDPVATLENGQSLPVRGRHERIDASRVVWSASEGTFEWRHERIVWVPPRSMASALREDFAGFEVTATLREDRSVVARLIARPDFSCVQRIEVTGKAGTPGKGDLPPVERTATPGGPGGDGADAPPVEVFAGLVESKKEGTLVVYVVRSGISTRAESRTFLVRPDAGKLVVVARGGDGGPGGRGGAGVDGRHKPDCSVAERGTPGARGGNGGNGANASTLTVYFDERHPEIGRTLELMSGPGSSGLPGPGGEGGIQGLPTGCERMPKRAIAATDGDGATGLPGRGGPLPVHRAVPAREIQTAVDGTLR